MTFSWQYPIFLCPHETGYASLAVAGKEEQILVIYTEHQAATIFMQSNAIPGSPRPLQNDREFAWLLRGLREPVVQVAFDPELHDDSFDSRWETTVSALLEQLQPDYSPWNYPVHVVALETGFVSIQSEQNESVTPATAIAVFTSEQQAEHYLAGSPQTGTLCALNNVEEARSFLEGMRGEIEAVALNPQIVDDRHTALRCFQVSTLLDKYLVSE